ncbi:ABC transporter permease subunit, partial [Achromobacter sp.]
MTDATTMAPAPLRAGGQTPGALRRKLWQCAVGAALALLVIASGFILRDNLQRLGLTVGFDFLQRPAGFQIGVSLLPYAPTDSIAYAILTGALNTVMLVVLAGVCATVLGVAIGLARRSVNPLVRGLTLGYVELLRNTPLLMQILLWSAVLLKLPPAAKAL